MNGKMYLTHDRMTECAHASPKTSEVFGRNSTNTIILVSLLHAGNDDDNVHNN